MKNKTVILEKAFQAWAFLLMAMFVIATGITVFNLITGNYHSTASFEF